LILGGALCYGGSRLGFGAIDKPGSGFMSWMTGGLLILLGSGSIVSKFILGTETEPPEEAPDGKFWRKRLYSILALVLYASFLDLLGFILATFLLLFFLFKILSPQKWFSPVLISLIAVILSYLLFHVWLRIDFPPGRFQIG
jgi:putative tricarboxylic transport membrane protein